LAPVGGSPGRRAAAERRRVLLPARGWADHHSARAARLEAAWRPDGRTVARRHRPAVLPPAQAPVPEMLRVAASASSRARVAGRPVRRVVAGLARRQVSQLLEPAFPVSGFPSVPKLEAAPRAQAAAWPARRAQAWERPSAEAWPGPAVLPGAALAASRAGPVPEAVVSVLQRVPV
jgi:hypothetical protein